MNTDVVFNVITIFKYGWKAKFGQLYERRHQIILIKSNEII